MNATIVNYTLFEGHKDNAVHDYKRNECTWLEFCEMLSEPEFYEDKFKAQLITPAKYVDKDVCNDFTYKGTVRRCSENIEKWYMLPADIDGQMTIAQAMKRFKAFEYVLYTSHSHQTPEYKPFDCFRMFFLMQEPIANKYIVNRIPALKAFLGAHDNSTLAISRMFFLPSCSKTKYCDSIYYYNNGIPLDVMSFEEIEEVIYAAPSEPKVFVDSKDFNDMVFKKLYDLRMVDYDTWWKIGSALQSNGYTVNQFEDLSNYIRSHRDNLCTAQWRSSSGRTMHFGYLVNLCKEWFGADCFSNGKVPEPVDGMKSGLAAMQQKRKMMYNNIKNKDM